MLRPKLVDPRGVLHVQLTATSPGYGRYWPDEDLAPFVEHLWTVAWDVDKPTVSEVLPHPSVQLVIESGHSAVAGVHTGRFTRRFEGRGRVLGVKFLPGGFRPYLGGSVSDLTDRRVGLGELFGAPGEELEQRALAAPDLESAFAEIQQFLRARRPVASVAIELIGRIVGRAASDRGVTRVSQLVEESGLGPRQLQRLFEEHVGVRPKWVIQRYRLHEAAERIAASPEHDWADLALELGYADQAHFVRDFRRFVGSAPAAYARSFAR
ncbi:MAG: helix-turn-helix domain-containing protein [Thermoanaerobaculia bacterium]